MAFDQATNDPFEFQKGYALNDAGARQYFLDAGIPAYLLGAVQKTFTGAQGSMINTMTQADQIALLRNVDESLQASLADGYIDPQNAKLPLSAQQTAIAAAYKPGMDLNELSLLMLNIRPSELTADKASANAEVGSTKNEDLTFDAPHPDEVAAHTQLVNEARNYADQVRGHPVVDQDILDYFGDELSQDEIQVVMQTLADEGIDIRIEPPTQAPQPLQNKPDTALEDQGPELPANTFTMRI